MGRVCAGCCKSLIVAINTTVLIASLALLGVSIYAIVEQYQYNTFSGDGIPPWAVWIPFAFSLTLVIIALVGCCTTLNDNKCCMGFYSVLQFVFGILILISGAGLLVSVNSMEVVATTPNAANLSSDSWWSSYEQFLGDVTTGIFAGCCTFPTPPLPCGSPSNTVCQDTTTPNACYCVHSLSNFQSGVGVTQDNGNYCNALGVSCENPLTVPKSRMAYQNGIYKLFNSSFYAASIVFMVIGCILILASFGSCYLACCYKKNDTPKNQQAGAAAGTQQHGTGMTMA